MLSNGAAGIKCRQAFLQLLTTARTGPRNIIHDGQTGRLIPRARGSLLESARGALQLTQRSGLSSQSTLSKPRNKYDIEQVMERWFRCLDVPR